MTAWETRPTTPGRSRDHGAHRPSGRVLADQEWWAALAAVGAVVSLALIVATFTPWWSAAVLINVVVLYVASQSITEQQV